MSRTVFRRGITAAELSRLSSDHSLDVAYVEIKTESGDGETWTIGIGQFDLDRLSGSISERLEKAIGAKRYDFYERSLALKRAGDTTESESFDRLAKSAMLIYRSDLVGARDNLQRLSTSDVVLLVATEEGSSEARDFDNRRQAAQPMGK